MEKEKNKSNPEKTTNHPPHPHTLPDGKGGPEPCPLCNISEETLKRLREGGKDQKTKEKAGKNNER